MDPFLEESQKSGNKFDLKLLWRSFWRRKWLFFVPFILCLSMAAVTIKIMTPIYYASGQVQVSTTTYRHSMIAGQETRYSRRNEQADMRADMEILITSPAFMRKVVTELNLDEAVQVAAQAAGRPIPSDEAAISIADGKLQRMLRIDISGRNLFRIGIYSTDPAEAYRIATYMVELFIIEHRAARVAARGRNRDFLVQQRDQIAERLELSEANLNEFLTTTASSTLMDNPVNAGNIATVEENLGLLRERYYGQDTTELANLEKNARAILRQLPNTRTYGQDVVVTRILRELEDLGATLMTSDQIARDSNQRQADVVQLRIRLNSRIEELVLNNHPNFGVMDRNHVGQYVYFSLFRAEEKKLMDRLTRQVREFRDFAARQPAQMSRLAELQGEVARQREYIQEFDEEIATHTVNMEAGLSDVGFQFQVRRQPSHPRAPVEPNKIKLAFMGFVLSFCLGIGLVVLAILMDRTFKSVDEIERTLGVPVIGTLPLIQDDHFERKRKLRILRWVTIVLGILAVAAVGFLVIYPQLT